MNSVFENFNYEKQKPRSIMSFKNKSIWYKINPINYVSTGLMFGYQRMVSQQLGSQCAYETSCSEHAKRAIEHHGFFKGLVMGMYQLQSCTASTAADFPKHKLNSEGYIKNPVTIDEK